MVRRWLLIGLACWLLATPAGAAPGMQAPVPLNRPPKAEPAMALSGNAGSAPLDQTVIAGLVPLQDVKQVAAGGFHTCILTTAGGVKCWGRNSSGQLGDGTTADRSTLVDVVGLESGVAGLSVGAYHTCALTATGGVKCWGANGYGQLGDGTWSGKSTPVDVPGLGSAVAALAAGGFHTCAVMTTGGGKCWGHNESGQLGDGTTADKNTPVDVAGLVSGATGLAPGYRHTCALTTADGAKCWGWNDYGQLGDGTTTNWSMPVNVIGLESGVAAVRAGRWHTCALTVMGRVKCWGGNSSGQLGDGTTAQKGTPVDVAGLGEGVVALAAGEWHACALSAAGGVKCWGANDYGELGDGTTANKSTPVDVAGLESEVAGLTAGGCHTCALTAGGQVKCWGRNDYGQLGNGMAAHKSTPGDVLTDQCYALTLTHVGSGNDPTASPQRAFTCPTGHYTAGSDVMLTAAPAAGWRVAGWSGTSNDASTASTNTLIMPASNVTVNVWYEEIPGADGDPYEPDDSCALARFIPTEGTLQEHTFHKPSDQDWVAFNATAGTSYLILGDTAAGSPADLTVILYATCSGVPQQSQNFAFSPDFRLQFQAQTTGPIYLKLINHDPIVYGPHVAYSVAVRALSPTAQRGALVLVAGQRRDFELQEEIHRIAAHAYRVFLGHGYTADDIFYLTADLAQPGADAPATADDLRAAITTWARERVGPDRPLTVYLVDHGEYDRFLLDDRRGEYLAPDQLDTWLAEVEAARPGVKVNVILEACLSGSFIDPPKQVSRPGRVVVTSTGARNNAYASEQGAHFSTPFLDALNQGSSLYLAFQAARWSAQVATAENQTPWLDDNGNGIPNEPSDGQEAQRRGFIFAGTFSNTQWPPYIAEVVLPTTIQNGSGTLRARVLDNPQDGAQRVWAVIYPPSYTPPPPSSGLVRETLDSPNFIDRGGDWFEATYHGFRERGAYRVVIYAEDGEGLEARPVAMTVITGWGTYLPLVIR